MELTTQKSRCARQPAIGPEPRDRRADQWLEHLPKAPLAGDWPADKSVPVSVLVPVKNEEANLAECLLRLRWAEQIVVVDSQSADGTVPLAQASGAEVYQFYYSTDGWPKKKNWALAEVPWRNDWVLIMDADEHMTPELAREIAEAIAGKGPRADGFWLNRRFMFMGRWIRHCGYYPSWNLRLFKHQHGRYERIGNLGNTGSGDNEVHEHVVLSGGAEALYLKNDFLHYAYPDLATWVEKHNRYSTWEAHAMRVGDSGAVRPSLFGGPIARRRWLKAKTRRLPSRPFLRFLYAYVFQRGFLDGYAGYCLCALLAWYEFISLAKLHEMRLQQSASQGDIPP
jgi:glycosyltransferase involved in cell wall biosynthesis